MKSFTLWWSPHTRDYTHLMIDHDKWQLPLNCLKKKCFFFKAENCLTLRPRQFHSDRFRQAYHSWLSKSPPDDKTLKLSKEKGSIKSPSLLLCIVILTTDVWYCTALFRNWADTFLCTSIGFHVHSFLCWPHFFFFSADHSVLPYSSSCKSPSFSPLLG